MSGYDYEDHSDDVLMYAPSKPSFRWISKTEVVEPPKHPLYDPEKIAKHLNQKKYWVNAAKSRILISDMDKGYLYNVLLWVEKHSSEIYFTMTLAKEIGKLSEDVDYTDIFELPLLKRIRARYKALVEA